MTKEETTKKILDAMVEYTGYDIFIEGDPKDEEEIIYDCNTEDCGYCLFVESDEDCLYICCTLSPNDWTDKTEEEQNKIAKERLSDVLAIADCVNVDGDIYAEEGNASARLFIR